MSLVRTVGPTTEPLTLSEAKAHLRVDHPSEDTLIAALVQAAREYVEAFTHRALITQTWKLTIERFPSGDYIELPKAPLISVGSVQYIDTAGAQQTLATSVYDADTTCTPGVVRLKYDQSWPSTRDVWNAVEITFDAGYGAASAVPEPIKSAIRLLVGHLYANRESTVSGTINSEVRYAHEALLMPYRVYSL